MPKLSRVVGDEKLIRWSLRKNSIRFGDEVLEAEGGQEGLDEKGARGRSLRSDSGAGLRARLGGGGATADLARGRETGDSHGR
jgi:hypothetical protein